MTHKNLQHLGFYLSYYSGNTSWLRSYFPWFFVAASIIYGMQRYEIPLPSWINGYVNDFLCMPIVLYICRFVARRLRSDSDLSLPYPPVLVLTLFYAVFFEYYLPEIHPRYTADAFDVVLYFLGSGFFLAVQHVRSDNISPLS